MFGLKALKSIDPVHVIAAKHGVHPMQVRQWKKDVAERLPEVFTKLADDGAPACQRQVLLGHDHSMCILPPETTRKAGHRRLGGT